MIGVGVATASPGIVVGTVTLTGMGLMMTDFVEFISGDNVVLMLLFTAMISLVLGMGIPTTANYILVATLMAPVVVELGAQAGLAIPLIAVHLFVFYYGIMAIPPRGRVQFQVEGLSIEGKEVRKTVSLRLDRGGQPAERLAGAGLRLRTLGEDVRVERVDFGSYAERVRIEAGFAVTAVREPASRPSPHFFYIPATALLGLIVAAQYARRGRQPVPSALGSSR